MSDEYALVSRGKLKLKSDKKDKKSKKSKKDGVKDGRIDKNKPNGTTEEQYSSEYTRPSDNNKPKLTKAELSYKKMREKMQEKRIMEKASTTHKQRVEKFNEHLDSLTEHFDIPKVSWTK